MGLRRWLATAYALVLTGAGQASGGVTLEVDVNGYLTGARNVAVSGQFYDVKFVDGTCAGVFGPCTNDSFAFHGYQSALAASEALMAQVLLDVSTSWLFDSRPWLIDGCAEASGLCMVATPWSFVPSRPETPDDGSVTAVLAYDRVAETGDMVAGTYIGSSVDTSTRSDKVWADWTPASRSELPEPATLLIVAAGLVAIGANRRRRGVVTGV